MAKKPEVPDYAYDLHTAKGRAMGRDEMHFLTEASRVIPQLEGEDIVRIHEQYIEFCQARERDDRQAGGTSLSTITAGSINQNNHLPPLKKEYRPIQDGPVLFLGCKPAALQVK